MEFTTIDYIELFFSVVTLVILAPLGLWMLVRDIIKDRTATREADVEDISPSIKVIELPSPADLTTVEADDRSNAAPEGIAIVA